MQELELAVGEVGHERPQLCLPAGEVEHERPRAERVVTAGRRGGVPKLDVDPRDQLVEGERLRHVVACSELEAAQLGRQVDPRREDHDRRLGVGALKLAQHGQSVDAGQQQVEDDEVMVAAPDRSQRLDAVTRRVDAETLRLEAADEKRKNPRFVLDDKDPHCAGASLSDWKMTAK